jgi:hypothetical protein
MQSRIFTVSDNNNAMNGAFHEMREIDEYYRTEPHIQIANDYMIPLVFRGEYIITVVDQVKDVVKKIKKNSTQMNELIKQMETNATSEATSIPIKSSIKGVKKILKINEDFKKEIKQALIEGHHNRKMFGFCPIKVYHDSAKGRKCISVPAFGTGKIEKRYNTMSDKYEFFYLPLASGQTTRPGERYYCYTWPGKNPGVGTDYISEVRKLWESHCRLQEAWKNFQQADFENAYQKIVCTNTQKTSSIQEMTTEQILSDNRIHEEQIELYQKDTDRGMRITKFESSSMATRDAKRPYTSSVRYDQRLGIKRNYDRLNTIEMGNVYALPTGEQIAATPVPKIRSIAELTQMEDHYYSLVCLIMGVPRSYFTTDSKAYKTDQVQEQEALFQRIDGIRNEMKEFFAFISSKLRYDEIGNMVADIKEQLQNEKLLKQEYISRKITAINDIEQWEEVFSKLNISRFSSAKRTVTSVADDIYEDKSSIDVTLQDTGMKDQQYIRLVNRGFADYLSRQLDEEYDQREAEVDSLMDAQLLKLEFPGLPFLQFKPLQEIDYAIQHGFMTTQERVLTIRNRVGLETDERTLEEIVKRVEKEEKEAKELEKQKMLGSKGNGVGAPGPGQNKSEAPKKETPKTKESKVEKDSSEKPSKKSKKIKD